MSLLLEALKKAEKAKEEAQRRARADAGAAELRFGGAAASGDEPASDAKPVLTRAELPDIKQPLEILSDDIAPKDTPSPEPAARAPRPSAPPGPAAEAQAAERAAARNVFEAKLAEPDPRRSFHLVLGVLAAVALGTVAYFWYQLRPPPALVNLNPPRAGSELPAQVVALQPAGAPTRTAQAAIPGLPPVAAAATAAPAATVPLPKPRAPEPRTETPQMETPRVETPAPKPRPAPRAVRPAAPAPAQQAVSTVSTSRPARPQIHPKVEAAYAAYLKGDLEAARIDYQDALREDAANRDALLGLAAIEVRTGRLESAEATYLRLLQIDPADAHAQAGLIALRGNRLDPLATESRVKSMLAARPEANVLHFTLGNQLAQQGRWAEAQQEYFKAFAADPENADFAYNLAVSLDHVRQAKLALEYYRRALALAERRGASFDVAAARSRAAQLER